MEPSRDTSRYGLLLGPRVATVFRVVEDRPVPPGVTFPTGGLIPTRDEIARALDEPEVAEPDWIVSGAQAPRATIDGRSSLNPQVVRVTASALVKAGGIPAGPLPSDAVAVDLYAQELVRQDPDILVMSQPIAGDKLKSLERLLSDQTYTEDPLPIIYNGSPTAGHRVIENSPGAAYRAIPPTVVSGRANPEPVEQALQSAVSSVVDRRLAEAGYESAGRVSLGRAATAASRSLAEWARSLVVPGGHAARNGSRAVRANGGAGGEGNGTDTRHAVCLVVAEADQAAVFLPHVEPGGVYPPNECEIDAAIISLVGTGTIDLAGKNNVRAGAAAVEGWLPSWDNLLQRLPLDLDTSEVGNLAAATLVEPWREAAGLAEATVGSALIEEMLHRLDRRWPDAVRADTSPSHCRVIVGAGFGFARLGDCRHAAGCLINAFQPGGVTTLAIDPAGAFLAATGASLLSGLKARIEPETVAVCVSPLKALRRRSRKRNGNGHTDPWAIVTVERADGQTAARRLVPGRIAVIPVPPGETAQLTIEPCLPSLDFGAGSGRVWTGRIPGSTVGVILDGRGRPIEPSEDVLARTTKHRELLGALGLLDSRAADLIVTAAAESSADRRTPSDGETQLAGGAGPTGEGM